MMKFTESDKALLLKLKDAGIVFVVPCRGWGYRNVRIDDLELYLQDSLKFEVQALGISEEQYRKWLDYYNDGYSPCCISITKKGRPCGGHVHPYIGPREFVDGVTNCCTVHSRHGLTYERRDD